MHSRQVYSALAGMKQGGGSMGAGAWSRAQAQACWNSAPRAGQSDAVVGFDALPAVTCPHQGGIQRLGVMSARLIVKGHTLMPCSLCMVRNLRPPRTPCSEAAAWLDTPDSVWRQLRGGRCAAELQLWVPGDGSVTGSGGWAPREVRICATPLPWRQPVRLASRSAVDGASSGVLCRPTEPTLLSEDGTA